MLRLGSALRHLECVAWKPGEHWETPWLRGHISGTLLNSTSNPCDKGWGGGKAVPQHQDQHCQRGCCWGRMKQSWPKRVAKSTRNTWAHKEDNVGTRIFFQSTRKKSHPNRHSNYLFSLLPISWKHWNLQGKKSEYTEIKIYVMKKSSPARLHLRNTESS